MVSSEKFTLFIQTFDRIMKNIRRIATPVMRRYGLRGVHAVCILELNQRPWGMTVTEISRYCMVDKALSSRMVRELLDGGFLTPAEDADSRYNLRYVPTPRVQEVVQDLNQVIEKYVNSAGKDISSHELTVFYKVLASLDRNIESLTEGILI